MPDRAAVNPKGVLAGHESAFPGRLRSRLQGAESQEALAAKAGISVSGLKKWLRGEAEPTLGNLVRLASVLNVSVEWLATGRGTAESGKEVVPLPVAHGEEPPPGWVTTPRYQVEVGAGA